MNREQIIQMAREKMEELEKRYHMGGLSDGLYGDFATDVALEVAAAIRAATKEEDARICENTGDCSCDDHIECADAIRASK